LGDRSDLSLSLWLLADQVVLIGFKHIKSHIDLREFHVVSVLHLEVLHVSRVNRDTFWGDPSLDLRAGGVATTSWKFHVHVPRELFLDKSFQGL